MVPPAANSKILLFHRHCFEMIGYEIGRAETDTELTDHRMLAPESLHKSLERDNFRTRQRSGNRNLLWCQTSKVVDQVCVGHTNTSITDREYFVLLVWSDSAEQRVSQWRGTIPLTNRLLPSSGSQKLHVRVVLHYITSVYGPSINVFAILSTATACSLFSPYHGRRPFKYCKI
jgi:hypothetical protein